VGDVATLRRAVNTISVGQVPLPVALIESPAEVGSLPPRCLPVLQVGALAE
jgi:4-hydroxythreonine-4-phosphate dehydrogenase